MGEHGGEEGVGSAGAVSFVLSCPAPDPHCSSDCP